MQPLSTCLVLVLIAVVSAEWQKPSFCKRNDCPEFEVLETNDEYQVRRYPAAKWVSTSYSGSSERDMRRKMNYSFWTLFGYISGRNDQGMKIAMTTPVTTRLSMCTDASCEPSFERSFYIPPEHQTDAPAATTDGVYVHEWPQLTVYVRSFGGWASNWKYEQQLQQLEAAIGDPDLFDTTQYYQVGYDSPMTWWNRHNEVWLIKNEQ